MKYPFYSPLVLTLIALTLAPMQAEETALYSNIPDPLPAAGQGRWIFPHKGDPIQAQSFTTGESGVISTIKLPLIRHGTPGGVVHVEIWSASNDKPHNKVANVGDVDLETLAPAPGEVVVFDNLQLKLDPNTEYFLATNNADAVIVDGFPQTAGATYCFLTDDSNEGTNGASKLQVLAGSWTPLERFIGIAKYQNMEILETSATTLYDNIEEPLEFRGRSIFQTPEFKGLLAQPFTTGVHGTISSVALPVARLGSPSGIVTVEIWDDRDGRPGEKVATVGEFEIAELTLADDGGEILRFQPNITNLDAQSRYYLVTDDTNTDVADINKSYLVQTAPGNEGTSGAAKFLAFGQIDTDWVIIGDQPEARNRNYRTMEILESAAPVSNHTLTIAPSEHGTVTIDPDMATYAAGTEVTLTATPNEGYEFSGWTAETTSGEPRATTVFDNLDHPRDQYNSPLGRDRKFAQQFRMDGARTLKQVELELFRIGTVQGGMAVELWNDDGDDPGEKVADLGTIDDVSTIPTSDTAITFDAVVSDLDPDGKYWVVAQFESITSTLTGSNTIGWTFSFSGDGANTSVDAHAIRAQDNGKWGDFPQVVGHPRPIMHQMRVQTLAPSSDPLELPNENPVSFFIKADTTVSANFAPTSTDPFIIARTDDGSVTADPILDAYPIGSEVTVTATPRGGLEFVKWLYGDEEFTTNPATITITSGATLTPIFAPAEPEPEPEPLEIDILPAMAIRWDSQAGRMYEIQSSPDLQDWTTEAENVEGSGEAMTHFFLRDAREMYYRILEFQ